MSHRNAGQIFSLVYLGGQIRRPMMYHLWIIHWLASSFFLNQRLWLTHSSYWTLKPG